MVTKLAVVKQVREKGPPLATAMTAKMEELNKGILAFQNSMNACDKLDGVDAAVLAKLPATLSTIVAEFSTTVTAIQGGMAKVETTVLPQLAKCEPLIKTAVSDIEVCAPYPYTIHIHAHYTYTVYFYIFIYIVVIFSSTTK